MTRTTTVNVVGEYQSGQQYLAGEMTVFGGKVRRISTDVPKGTLVTEAFLDPIPSTPQSVFQNNYFYEVGATITDTYGNILVNQIAHTSASSGGYLGSQEVGNWKPVGVWQYQVPSGQSSFSLPQFYGDPSGVTNGCSNQAKIALPYGGGTFTLYLSSEMFTTEAEILNGSDPTTLVVSTPAAYVFWDTTNGGVPAKQVSLAPRERLKVFRTGYNTLSALTLISRSFPRFNSGALRVSAANSETAYHSVNTLATSIRAVTIPDVDVDLGKIPSQYTASGGKVTVTGVDGVGVSFTVGKWSYHVGAVAVALVSGQNAVLIAGSSNPSPSLPATPSVGDYVTLRVTSASAFPMTLSRNGSTISGSASDYTIARDGTYYLRYYNNTWNIEFSPSIESSKWIITSQNTSFAAEVNRSYYADGGTMTLPSGAADGDTIRVRPIIPGVAWSTFGLTVASGGTRYLRPIETTSGTATSHLISYGRTDAYLGGLDAVYVYTWHAATGCWYYTRQRDAGGFLFASDFSLRDDTGYRSLKFNVSNVPDMTQKTITMASVDVDIGGIPYLNTMNSNSVAGTYSAITTGASNKTSKANQHVLAGQGVNFDLRLPRNCVAYGDAASVSKNNNGTAAEWVLNAASTSTFSATFDEDNQGSGNGPYPTLTKPTNAHAVACHEFTFMLATADGKVWGGARRAFYRFNGSTVSVSSIDTIGTDFNPDGLSISISIGVSDLRMTLIAINNSGVSGQANYWTCRGKSFYNGGGT